MSTLREAIEAANMQLEKEVTFDATKRLKEMSAKAALQLDRSYSDFFDTLYEEVINSGEGGEYPGGPNLTGFPKWHSISYSWGLKKEQVFSKTGNANVLTYYHGVTDALTGTLFRKKGRKRRTRRKGGTSFDTYIKALANNSSANVKTLFGPLNVAYSITRPDGGTVKLQQLDNVITNVNRARVKGKFAAWANGTVLHTTITAFPNLEGNFDEYELIQYLIGHLGNEKQWFKVTGGANFGGKWRPIIAPLIRWYMEVELKDIMRASLK